MSFRELTMIAVKEVARRCQARQGLREIARETGLDRKTVRRYAEALKALGPVGASSGVSAVTEEELTEEASRNAR